MSSRSVYKALVGVRTRKNFSRGATKPGVHELGVYRFETCQVCAQPDQAADRGDALSGKNVQDVQEARSEHVGSRTGVNEDEEAVQEERGGLGPD